MLPSREFPNVYIKDEGLNPTGSFKARGMSAAVTMAKAYGLKKLAAPSAGNAASALAAYAAAAGLEAHIFMPKDVPLANRVECESYGANVTLVDGLISDCARMVAERKEKEGWFDVSTLKEPFRVEGKKTMGYEVAEQLGWRMPQGIIYPTGGGVGLIGMWKAFEEMQDLGWIGAERPQMIAVQAAGCAPIAKAWDDAKPTAEFWPNAATLAAGLRVPKAYGDYLILDILKKSGGVALAVTRRRNHGCVAAMGAGGRSFCGSGRSGSASRLSKVARQHVLRSARHGGAVQHRIRFEIPGRNRGPKEVPAPTGSRLAANRRNYRTILSSAAVPPLLPTSGCAGKHAGATESNHD